MNKVRGKVNRPLCYMDHNNSFDNQQVEKINSMIKNQYNRFTDKTFQEQQNDPNISNAISAKSNLISNLASFEYNNIGFANFQFIMYIAEENQTYKLFECKHEIVGNINASGSAASSMYDSVSDYGYFWADGNSIYFTLVHEPQFIIYPYCTLNWVYKD